MTLHGALTIEADVTPGKEDKLARLLKQLDEDPLGKELVPFEKINSLHFARFVLLPARPDAKGSPVPCRLVFTTNYDQPQKDHLHELMIHAGPGLWQAFSHCKGFPDNPEASYDAVMLDRFITAHSMKANTFYAGVGNRSVTQIRQENQLRENIQGYIDQKGERLTSETATNMRETIRQFVFSQPGLTWAKEPDPNSTPAYSLSQVTRLTAVILLFLLLSPILLPFLFVWVIILLYQELTGINEGCSIDKAHWESLVTRETAVGQNQFSAFGNVKPGRVRYHTIMALLKLTDFLAPYLFNKGTLSGIPTVHFARWLIISEGRQMLFLSNYDGNSEGYLRDFIHIAAKQLTLLFSHTVGYPKTWLMVFGGARDANGFMQWARQNQLITNVWYSANPGVSVKNIFQNAKIRAGLYGAMSEKQAREWLRLL